jgi:type VI secretion system protein ImpL
LFEDLNDQQHSVTYEGPWAWFRLQDRSKLAKTPVANVYLATYSAIDGNHNGDEAIKDSGSHTVRYEIKGQSANNPLNKELLGGFRCVDGI